MPVMIRVKEVPEKWRKFPKDVQKDLLGAELEADIFKNKKGVLFAKVITTKAECALNQSGRFWAKECCRKLASLESVIIFQGKEFRVLPPWSFCLDPLITERTLG